MTSRSSGPYYRIGDFAKFMGVTPYFLKHYESHGLLQVHQHTDSNYRFYAFDQAPRILEYMRLRNYGVAVKDMDALLRSNDFDAVKHLESHTEELQKKADKILAVIEEQKRVKRWFEDRRTKPLDWEVVDVERHYFLPHSNHQDFIKDERIHSMLKIWGNWMPIAKSALRVDLTSEDHSQKSASWGLMLPESIINRYKIPFNEAVIEMKPCKSFIYHFVAEENFFNIQDITQKKHPVFTKMSEFGLKPINSFYLSVEMKFIDDNGKWRSGAGRFIIPVSD